jgi:predicted acylesterase/phospholipase RssA
MHPVHPRFGRALGFRAEFIAVRMLRRARAMHEVLMASSGVPPFMPVTLVNGMPAFDGGLVDNVPVEPLAPIESAGGRTLVLLTRLYKDLPAVVGRTYVQPSRKIDLSQFDITNPDSRHRWENSRHCEPTVGAKRRPMREAIQSCGSKTGLLRRKRSSQ